MFWWQQHLDQTVWCCRAARRYLSAKNNNALVLVFCMKTAVVVSKSVVFRRNTHPGAGGIQRWLHVPASTECVGFVVHAIVGCRTLVSTAKGLLLCLPRARCLTQHFACMVTTLVREGHRRGVFGVASFRVAPVAINSSKY